MALLQPLPLQLSRHSTAQQHACLLHVHSLRSVPHAAAALQRRRPLRQPAKRLMCAAGKVVDVRNSWWDKNNATNMKSIHSVDEFILELSQARDKLVVVDFFAQWCGSCKALHPKLCQLATDNPDNMLMLKVEFDSNKALAKALGVKVLPYFQFYRGAEGRVAAFSASVAKVQRLRDALTQHSSPYCSLGTSPIISELSSLLSVDAGGRVVPGPQAQQQNAQAVPV